MTVVTLLASSEITDSFRARVTLHALPEAPVYVEAGLYVRKSPVGDFKRIESLSVFTSKNCFDLIFSTEIREIGLWSVLSFLVSEAQPGSTVHDLVGRFTIPVFTSAGMLVRGPQVVIADKRKGTEDNPLEPSNEYICSLSDSTTAEIIRGVCRNFPLANKISDEDRVWGLEPVTELTLIKELKEVWLHPFAVIDMNPDCESVIFSGESCKSLNHFARQVSSSELSITKPVPTVCMDEECVDGHLASWMVINGPMESRKNGVNSGTGYVVDLKSAMSPSSIQVVDYELFREHPAATKAARIQRFASRYAVSASMAQPPRPNADEVAALNDIILQPMRDLSITERELVLKFMWSLLNKKQALLKVILVAVDSLESNGSEATVIETLVEKILTEWTPVDIDGALALLGEEVGKLTPGNVSVSIRKYAVNRLGSVASNSEIQLFLFQLVQSLRYDADENLTVANFLIDRACKDEELASMLFWHLQCEVPLYDHVSQQLWSSLGRSEQGRRIRDGLELQCEFRDRLMDIANVIRTPSLRMMEVGQSKNEILKEAIRGNLTARTQLLSVIGRLNLSNKLNFPEVGGDSVEIPIPLDPALCLVRVEDGKSFCIKSAKAPFVISCDVFNRRTRQSESRRYMFKTGDDLRQDQLIIQLISLFDGLFKSYGLDLKLTPYKVLATSTEDGFVEFVADSNTLSSVLANHGNDLLTYFRSIRPKADAPYGVDPSVLDTFARSCAGYCAITYVLGIGDRHLDNLLITTDGRLFHVDFGYILGRDPKPFPPPMKLCREMVDGMGGTGSVYYRSFVSKCTQAFLIIRRHASLLISLLYLAAEANLKDMREQDPTLAILKVQKRLMPELSDEVAEQQMVNLINESTNALFPVVMEKLHKWAIYWRN